jgi:hypothetical protein
MDILDRLKTEARKEPNEPIWRDAIAEIQRLQSALEKIIDWSGDCVDHPDHIGEPNARELASYALHPLSWIKEKSEEPR